MTQPLLIASIAAAVSFVASMVGLGGAVLLIPAYLYLPQLLGSGALGAREVSGMTSVQVLATSILAGALHRRKGTVSTRIVLAMGLPIVASTFLGALWSGYIDPRWIVLAFAVMAVLGAVLVAVRSSDDPDYDPDRDFRPVAGGAIALCVGFFAGIAGAPGAFILSPLMMTILRIPTRITIGSTLGIIILSSASASAGKLLTGQVLAELTIPAVLGAIPGSLAGAALSHRLQVRTLRMTLAAVIGGVGVLMLFQAAGALF